VPSTGVDYVLHRQRWFRTRSLNDPIAYQTKQTFSGFFEYARWSGEDAEISGKKLNLLPSSAVPTTADHPGLPKVEEAYRQTLSPYAVTKLRLTTYAYMFFAKNKLMASIL